MQLVPHPFNVNWAKRPSMRKRGSSSAAGGAAVVVGGAAVLLTSVGVCLSAQPAASPAPVPAQSSDLTVLNVHRTDVSERVWSCLPWNGGTVIDDNTISVQVHYLNDCHRIAEQAAADDANRDAHEADLAAEHAYHDVPLNDADWGPVHIGRQKHKQQQSKAAQPSTTEKESQSSDGSSSQTITRTDGQGGTDTVTTRTSSKGKVTVTRSHSQKGN